jgi:very-short-patch-repair endonuclease
MGGKPLPRGQELASLARRQHGVVSIRQLQRLGYSHQSVSRAAAAGRLHRLHLGVYAVGHMDLSLQGRCLAGVLASGPGALLSHFSAAWLLELLTTSPIPVHVTTPLPRKQRGALRLHHSRTLTEADRGLRQMIPVTSIARTSLDLAPLVRFRSLRRMVRRAEDLRVFDLAEFRSVLERNRGHHGVVGLERALAIYEPLRLTRSELERELVTAVEAAGLPVPSTAFVVAGCELDLYWPELRFAVEVDVYATHGSHESFEEDRLRDENLKLAGVELIRVTGHRFEREPEEVVNRIGRLLDQRGRQLGVSLRSV